MLRSDVVTKDDLGRYIEENADIIYVREIIDGRWGSFSLKELPIDLALKHKQRFLDEDRLPAVVEREEVKRP